MATMQSNVIRAVLCVVGARPNFMKMAPILGAFSSAVPRVPARLVHTGQHYDIAMNEQHFDALGLPRPDISLEVGSGSHAVQTAEVMRRFEPVLEEADPAAVLVVGDVNSTLACALVATKRGVPVIHVEAGLRSFDRSMPEEVNRVLTDQISDLLFTTEEGALANLEREGIPESRVRFVGNVMIDSVHRNLDRAVPSGETLGRATPAPPAHYGVVTLHRPSNVDDPAILRSLLRTLADVSRDLPLVFPVHPRTRARIDELDEAAWRDAAGVLVTEPLDYLSMLGLMRDAAVVLTDSGGMQEETTALGVPCLTLRHNTERPITVEQGTNTIVGTDPARILDAVADVLRTGGKAGRIPPKWDGRAAPRIAEELAAWLKARDREVA